MVKISETKFHPKDIVKKDEPPVRVPIPAATPVAPLVDPDKQENKELPGIPVNPESSTPVGNVELEDIGEEDMEEVLSQAKRDALAILRQHLEKMKSGKMILNERSFRSMQQMFESLGKQEIAREDMLMKKRKENRADSMAVFDLYGRFGVPDKTTIESMRQTLYGPRHNLQLVRSGSSEKVAGVAGEDAGASVPQDGAAVAGER